MSRRKKLQMKVDAKWEYVFAYSAQVPGQIWTTKHPEKALDSRDLEYFQTRFSSREFRVV